MKRIENFEAIWREVVNSNLCVMKGDNGITLVRATQQDGGSAIHASPLTDQRVLHVRVEKDRQDDDPLHEIFIAPDGTIINSGGKTPLSEDEAVDLARRTFDLAQERFEQVEAFRRQIQSR